MIDGSCLVELSLFFSFLVRRSTRERHTFPLNLAYTSPIQPRWRTISRIDSRRLRATHSELLTRKRNHHKPREICSQELPTLQLLSGNRFRTTTFIFVSTFFWNLCITKRRRFHLLPQPEYLSPTQIDPYPNPRYTHGERRSTPKPNTRMQVS